LQVLIKNRFLPVVSPVSVDELGNSLNVNADIAAGAIAGALTAQETLFLTDVPGIYRNWPDQSSLIEKISTSELKTMKFESGMIPKVSAAINAVESGARSARILDGKSLWAFEEALAGRGGTWVSA
jgi:acetylglutamate kinase